MPIEGYTLLYKKQIVLLAFRSALSISTQWTSCDGDVIKNAAIPIHRTIVLAFSRPWKFLLPRTTCKSELPGTQV